MPTATETLTLTGPDGREVVLTKHLDGSARLQVRTKTKSIAFLLDYSQQDEIANFFAGYSE